MQGLYKGSQGDCMFFLERRRIARRIRQLNKLLYEGDGPPTVEELKAIDAELQPLEDRLGLVETGRLERKATALAIDIPDEKQKPDWWRSGISVGAMVENKFYEVETKVLSPKGQRGARKLIKEEQFRITKRWSELLIPILSLIIAILALTLKSAEPFK
jgi:hypothetical protein